MPQGKLNNIIDITQPNRKWATSPHDQTGPEDLLSAEHTSLVLICHLKASSLKESVECVVGIHREPTSGGGGLHLPVL